jgi:hypothetical protein
MTAAEQLKIACDSILANKDLIKRDITGDNIDETFCNQGVQLVCSSFGYKLFQERSMSANQIVEFISKDPSWSKVSPIAARDRALEGRIVVVGKMYPTHGHVAIVYPSKKLVRSGTWNSDVPLIANIGRTNGLMPVNEAFPVKLGMPEFFLYTRVV